MAALSYTDGELQFPSLSILLPPLVVKAYETETGRLSLSLSGAQLVTNKISALQNAMITNAHTNHRSWFPGEKERGHEELACMFQPLISHGALHLYCPLTTAGSFNEIQLYSGGAWSRGTISSAVFATGKQIRIAVRLQGLSFHQHHITRAWTGKSRVQHRILAVYTD